MLIINRKKQDRCYVLSLNFLPPGPANAVLGINLRLIVSAQAIKISERGAVTVARIVATVADMQPIYALRDH